jgi:hypothetical protein
VSTPTLVTVERIAEWKVEATAMKADLGIKQTAALARIAQREGYRSWEVLMSKVGRSADLRDVLRVERHRIKNEASVP